MEEELDRLYEERQELDKKISETAKKNRGPVIDAMKKNISRYGISANELGFFENSTAAVKPAVTSSPIKYQQGEKTWTGRGRKPQFIVDHTSAGGNIEDLHVK